MKKQFLAANILLLSLTGCGKFFDQFSRLPQGFTKVVFNHNSQAVRDLSLGLFGPGSIHANSVLGGGAVIYARNAQTGLTYSGSVADEGSTLALTLPNGDYAFSAFGWPTNNLTDTNTTYVRCGTAPALTLSGEAKDVTLDLSDTNACYSSSDFAIGAVKQSGSPGTIGTLSLNFCHKSTNLTSMGMASYCSGVDASSNFYAGDPTYAKIDRVNVLGSSLIFTATHSSHVASPPSGPPDSPYELFRYDRSSGKQTKFPLSLTGYGVVNPQKPANHNKVLFLERDTGGLGTLWSYNLSDDSIVQVSQATADGTTTGVKEFRLSDDGNWVVFVGDLDTSGIDELYSVAIPGDASNTYGTINKISGTRPSPGVSNCGSCTNDRRYFFDISHGTSAPYVAFVATQSTLQPLFFASIDGSPLTAATIAGGGTSTVPSGAVISGSELGASGHVDQFQFTQDGHYLVYHANYSSTDKAMLLAVNYVPGTSLTVTTPTLLATGVSAPFFQLGSSTTKAVLVSGTIASGGNISTTFSVVDLTTPGTVTALFIENGGATALDVNGLTLAQNDTVMVTAFQDHSNSHGVDLVSIPLTSTTPHSYTGGVLASGQIKSVKGGGGGGGGGDFFRLSPDSSGLIFISDKAITNTFQLWSAPVGGSVSDASGTSITGAIPVVAAGFSSDGAIYFNAAIDVPGVNELYLSHPGAQPDRMHSSDYMGQVFDLGDSKDTSWTNVLPLSAAPFAPASASSIRQIYLFHTDTRTFESLGRIGAEDSTYDGSGRLRIAMMQANDGVNFTTAFDSGCLSFTGSNVDTTTRRIDTQVRIPTGPGGTSPFATEIDVYPLASDCSGTPERHFLPNGIGPTLGTVTSGVLTRASSGIVRLFVQDQ